MSDVRQISRAVVDLNLFVSGLISKLGLPHRLLAHFRNGAYVLVISRQLRNEIEEVLHRDKFVTRFGLTAELRTETLFSIDTKAIFVEPRSTPPVAVRDTKDEIVLATALEGHADFLVTGDVDLLVLSQDPRIGSLRIVTVREFLTFLDEEIEA